MATINDAVEEAPKNDMDVEPSQKTKNNRKKRKRPARDDTTEPDTNLQIKTKASKKQELQQGTRSSPDLAADNESSKKRKRRKEKKSSPESIPKVRPPLEDTTGEKQKNETGFPDPEEDVDEGGLPDQAKKGISLHIIIPRPSLSEPPTSTFIRIQTIPRTISLEIQQSKAELVDPKFLESCGLSPSIFPIDMAYGLTKWLRYLRGMMAS